MAVKATSSSSSESSAHSSPSSSPVVQTRSQARRASHDVTEFHPGGEIVVTRGGRDYRPGDKLPKDKAAEIQRAFADAQRALHQEGASASDDPNHLRRPSVLLRVQSENGEPSADSVPLDLFTEVARVAVERFNEEEASSRKGSLDIDSTTDRRSRSSSQSSPKGSPATVRRASFDLGRVRSKSPSLNHTVAELKNIDHPERVTMLRITDPHVLDLGDCLKKYPNITDLTIADCPLLSSLSFVHNLRLLKNLTVNRTNISKIPDAVVQMPHLKELDVIGNPRLRTLPIVGSIGPHLTRIAYDPDTTIIPEIYRQQVGMQLLENVPPEKASSKAVIEGEDVTDLINAILAIKGVENLQKLEIRDCPNVSSLDFVHTLPKLQALVVTGTNISEIPLDVLKMKNLEHLDIRGNSKLKALPQPEAKGPAFHFGANLKTITIDKGVVVPPIYRTKEGLKIIEA